MLFPPRCPICDRALRAGQEGICESCQPELEYPSGNRCSRCSKPIPEEEEFCLDCKAKQADALSGRAVLLYNRAMQESVGRFKYHGRQEYRDFYGKVLWEREGDWLRKIGADLLVPVPLYAARYRSRGYNQAELLAKALSRYSGIPVANGILVRTRNTLPQKELSDRERVQNVQSAFVADPRVKLLYPSAKCAIIIDDIYTTGSTVEACAEVLRGMHYDKIYFLCLCIGKDV